MIKMAFQKLLACTLFFAAAYVCAWSGGLLFRYIVQNIKDIGVVFLPFQIFAVFLLGCMSLVSIVAGVMFLLSGGSDDVVRRNEHRKDHYQSGGGSIKSFSMN